MSKASVIFTFKDKETVIECLTTEKLINICKRYISKIKDDISRLYFMYNGNIINKESTYEELKIEKDKNSINILVGEINPNHKRIINENNIIKNEINNNYNNYIIGEINIKKEDVNNNIKIISSFEECKRENKWVDKEYDYIYENEFEIKNNIIIYINNKLIRFNYYYRFKESGIYEIKYIFKKNISHINFMFDNCNSLVKLDLSNFNTQNVTNMCDMFNRCYNLKKIILDNFKTQNVYDMSFMFYYCESLENLDLSNFNTQNVTNMRSMFGFCCSLTDLDLSNFDTQNVKNMRNMFCE